MPASSYAIEGDEDPEILHLMSKGYTRDQAMQIASSTRSRIQQENAMNSSRSLGGGDARWRGADAYEENGMGRDQFTQSMLQRMTSPDNRNYAGSVNPSLSPYGPPNLSSQSMSFYERPASNGAYDYPPPVANNRSIFRASQPLYEPPVQDDYYAPNDFLPPPRSAQPSNLRSASASTSDNMQAPYGGSQMGGTSFYGTTVVGDYIDYAAPYAALPAVGPSREAALAALLNQQQAEFGVNMYEAMTPADSPEIQRLMEEGYSEEDAIQMIFDLRYRHRGGMLPRPPPYPAAMHSMPSAQTMQLQPPMMPMNSGASVVSTPLSPGGSGSAASNHNLVRSSGSVASHSTGNLLGSMEQTRHLASDDAHSRSMYQPSVSQIILCLRFTPFIYCSSIDNRSQYHRTAKKRSVWYQEFLLFSIKTRSLSKVIL